MFNLGQKKGDQNDIKRKSPFSDSFFFSRSQKKEGDCQLNNNKQWHEKVHYPVVWNSVLSGDFMLHPKSIGHLIAHF